jgi:hypothetical protein
MADRLNFESAMPFMPTTKSAASNDGDQLDAAGHTILKLLHKGAMSPKQIANVHWRGSDLTGYAFRVRAGRTGRNARQAVRRTGTG